MAVIRLVIHTHTEGPTALHPQRGDIKRAEPASWEPPEKLLKRELVIEVDDYNDEYGDLSILGKPEYGIGESGDPVMVRYGAYAVNFDLKLDLDLLAEVDDPDMLVNVVQGVFHQGDIYQKK